MKPFCRILVGDVLINVLTITGLYDIILMKILTTISVSLQLFTFSTFLNVLIFRSDFKHVSTCLWLFDATKSCRKTRTASNIQPALATIWMKHCQCGHKSNHSFIHFVSYFCSSCTKTPNN